MKPESVKKLHENVPEFRELLAYLADEAKKLNTLDGLAELSPEARADVVSGRITAFKKLADILRPLVDVQEKTVTRLDDYVA